MDRRQKRSRDSVEPPGGPPGKRGSALLPDPSGGPPGKRGPGLLPGEFTNDHSTVDSRIFVGNLPEDVTREDLKQHFSQWGNIQSVSITKNNFGFVQYETAKEAEYCLSHGYTTMINGTKVDVKPAKIGQGGSNAPKPFTMGYSAPPPSRDEYLPPRRGGGPSRGGGDSYPSELFPRQGGGRMEPYADDRYADDYYRDPYKRERLPPPPRDNGYYRDDERPPPTRGYAGPAYPVAPAAPIDPLDPGRPNDVEIVVPSKLQRPFAEGIERELKRLQMNVDLLFPPPEVTSTQVIRDLTSRRCLFAIFATGDNEKHRSVTVNILYGSQQEHRNMPVEDALRLVQQHFDEYVKKCRLRNMREVVPRDVRELLLDLLEMRPLSMGDLDKVIKYLRERQNALVDDQIEQKRENAAGGSKAPIGVSNLAVTYPGYNYIANTSAAIAGSSGIATQAVSLLPATTATAYPQVAYGTAQGVVGYGLPGQASAPTTQVAQMVGGRGTEGAQDRYMQIAKGLQSDSQQDRYMQMAKNSQGIAQVPVAVAPPMGVPAPQAVGAQRYQSWSDSPQALEGQRYQTRNDGQSVPAPQDVSGQRNQAWNDSSLAVGGQRNQAWNDNSQSVGGQRNQNWNDVQGKMENSAQSWEKQAPKMDTQSAVSQGKSYNPWQALMTDF